MSAYIFDTETTGIVKPIEIVEAAWWRLGSPKDVMGIETFSGRFSPSKAIEYGAMAMHHITNDLVKGCPPSSTFALEPDTEYIIGHNVDYDWEVIGSPNIKRICTLALARLLWPTVDSFSLGALIYYLKGSSAKGLLVGAHGAMVDVQNTGVLLTHIIPNLPGDIETWEQVWEHSEEARVPKIMTFGKHKLLPMEQVPIDYLQWLSRQPDLDPYMAKAISKRLFK